MNHNPAIKTLISDLHGLIYQFNCEHEETFMFCEMGKKSLKVGISNFERSKHTTFCGAYLINEIELQVQIDEIKEMLK